MKQKIDPILRIVRCTNERIICVRENYHETIEDAIRKRKCVKSDNGDWYERERNYDPETLMPRSGYHIIKWTNGLAPYEDVGSDKQFFKRIPEIWKNEK